MPDARKDVLLRRPKGFGRALIQGSLGRDPYYNDKGNFATITICTSFARKNVDTQEWEDVPTWWEIKILGEFGVAKLQRQGIAKGDYVECWVRDIELVEYNRDDYVDKKLVCIADNVESMVYREQGDNSSSSSSGKPKGRPKPKTQPQDQPQDDDVPF